ncbi:MAG: DUF389 domain-containing protein [Actinomycetota bacterium]|nr:DUF389 domain-containing protein [Acidimicrobiia bacterium]MDQ3292926.1 DUF389 domain-containing protein [Actinomycetota bacterium]
MLHLRITVPAEQATDIHQRLSRTPGVAHLAHLPGASTHPPGDLLLCDIAREAADAVVEWLQDELVHHRGAITIGSVGTVVSEAAARAEAAAPGHGSDALVWEELEAAARDDAYLTPSLLVLMGVAAAIAGVGILLDSPILVVGAMVVGPEYGPLSSLCVSAARRRWSNVGAALRTLGVAVLIGIAATYLLTLLLRVTTIAPDAYDISDRQLTAFISHPDALAAVVAALAGVAGMLSLTEARTGTLVGVLVSVTTIPAVANIGLAAAYTEADEVRGATLQLLVNVAGLTLAGIATLAIQSRLTARRR